VDGSPMKGSRSVMFLFFAFGVTAVFFVSCLLLLHYGRRLGVGYLRKHGGSTMPGFPAIEGAVFALIGLLLAFTIAGALQRYDERRQFVVQEASALSTAYDRLGLLERQARDLQNTLKEYTGARIDLYRMPHDFSLWEQEELWSREQQLKILELKNKLWNATAAACPESNYHPACSLALTALGNAFEAARLRLGAAEKHPPPIVYIMLFALGLGGSLLAGFGMAAAPSPSWIHMVIFAGAMALTLYVVTDLEFPRLGIIRIEYFDHFLVDAYDQMR
jgi:hypothetical protein